MTMVYSGLITAAVLTAATSLVAGPTAAQESQDWRWCSGHESTSPDQRLAACNAIIETSGDMPMSVAIAHCDRGIVYLQKGERDRAMAEFDQAVRLGPGRYAGLGCRGHAFFAEGDLGRAIADYDQAIDIDSLRPEAFIGRGLSYRLKGDLDRAIADFTEAAMRR